MTVGRRNLLERIARSRMARDAVGAWTLSALAIGSWVMITTVLRWISGR